MSVPVYINTRSYGTALLAKHGYPAIIHLVAETGATGIDLDPNWLKLDHKKIINLGRVITANNLDASAVSPIPLWLSDDWHPQLTTVLANASAFGAKSIKFRTGLRIGTQLTATHWQQLQTKLPTDLHIEITNGHEPSEGDIESIGIILKQLKNVYINASLNFDIANWAWVGIHANDAAKALGRFASSVQCRTNIQQNHNLLITTPSVVDLANWSSFWDNFSKNVIRCLDFPLNYGEVDEIDLAAFKSVGRLWLQRITHLA